MTSAPRVNVIIPAYNTAAYIGECVRSALAQTFTDHEVIVINDGSPDTPAMERAIAPYRDRITYIVQENAGISTARNAGIRRSRGEFIALLDSDDSWEPEYLEAQVAMLDSNPSLDVVYPNALIIGDHPHVGRTYMEVCPSQGEPTLERVLTQKCNVFISVLARREALESVGLFDPELRSVEDFDLWLRLLAAGRRIGYQRRVLVRFLKRRSSLSADPVWMAEHVLAVLDKAARTLDLGPRDRAALQERRRYFRAVLDLAQSKRAFFRLDTTAAVAALERANEYFQSRRLRVVAALLRTFPGVLLRLYRLRDRLLVGADTSF